MVQERPPSGGYENITAINVISRYAFAQPESTSTAVHNEKVIDDNWNGPAHLLPITITEKIPVFVSNVKHEIAKVLDITLRHATKNHAEHLAF